MDQGQSNSFIPCMIYTKEMIFFYFIEITGQLIVSILISVVYIETE